MGLEINDQDAPIILDIIDSIQEPGSVPESPKVAFSQLHLVHGCSEQGNERSLVDIVDRIEAKENMMLAGDDGEDCVRLQVPSDAI